MKQNRGFSLIESAIVLAIVGLVLGGIWAAASAVARKQAPNELIKFYSVAKDRAKSFRNITPSGIFPSAQILLNGRGVPPSFVPSATNEHVYIGPGMWVLIYFDGSSFQFRVFFYDDFGGADRETNPELCVPVLKFLNDEYSRGYPPIGQSLEVYARWVGNGNAMDGRSSSSAMPADKLPIEDILSLCEEASSVDIRQGS